MRTLDFTGEAGPKRYNILTAGVMGTDRGFKAPTETKVLTAILDKLESVGKDGVLDEAGSRSITFKESEYDLLREALGAVKWKTAGAKDATEMMEWFAEAQSGKDEA